MADKTPPLMADVLNFSIYFLPNIFYLILSLFSMYCELDFCWCAKGRMNVVLSNSIAFITVFGLFNFDHICFIIFWLNLFCDL